MQFDHYFIKPLASSDLDAFFQLIELNRDRLKAFFAGTVARTNTFEDTKEYLDEIAVKIENKIYLPFIIKDLETNALVGFIDIKNIDWNIPKGELGCFMDAKYAGKGLSKQAFSIFTEHCFQELKFKKMFLRTHESNTAAKKLAESCGFQIEGILRRDYKTSEGELVDLLYYGKIAAD